MGDQESLNYKICGLYYRLGSETNAKAERRSLQESKNGAPIGLYSMLGAQVKAPIGLGSKCERIFRLPVVKSYTNFLLIPWNAQLPFPNFRVNRVSSDLLTKLSDLLFFCKPLLECAIWCTVPRLWSRKICETAFRPTSKDGPLRTASTASIKDRRFKQKHCQIEQVASYLTNCKHKHGADWSSLREVSVIAKR